MASTTRNLILCCFHRLGYEGSVTVDALEVTVPAELLLHVYWLAVPTYLYTIVWRVCYMHHLPRHHHQCLRYCILSISHIILLCSAPYQFHVTVSSEIFETEHLRTGISSAETTPAPQACALTPTAICFRYSHVITGARSRHALRV